MPNIFNPFSWGRDGDWSGNPIGDDSFLGDITGTTGARDASRSGFKNAIGAEREGMDRALGALGASHDRARSDYDRAFGMYEQGISGLKEADLDPYYQQKWGALQGDVNAQYAKAGNYGGGGWARAMARGAAGLQAERERAHNEFQFQRLGALRGLADFGMHGADLENQYGGNVAGIYSGAYNRLAGLYGQQGQTEGQIAMAPWGSITGIAGAAAPAIGAYYGARAGGKG